MKKVVKVFSIKTRMVRRVGMRMKATCESDRWLWAMPGRILAESPCESVSEWSLELKRPSVAGKSMPRPWEPSHSAETINRPRAMTTRQNKRSPSLSLAVHCIYCHRGVPLRQQCIHPYRLPNRPHVTASMSSAFPQTQQSSCRQTALSVPGHYPCIPWPHSIGLPSPQGPPALLP